MPEIVAAIAAFVNDQRTLVLLGLIIINLGTGVMAALVRGTFQGQRIAEFYRTRVVPYILGYLMIYVLSTVGIAQLLGPVVGDLVAWGGAAVAGANLLADIYANLTEMRDKPPNPPAPTVVVTTTVQE